MFWFLQIPKNISKQRVKLSSLRGFYWACSLSYPRAALLSKYEVNFKSEKKDVCCFRTFATWLIAFCIE
jgi:hypothetical protein